MSYKCYRCGTYLVNSYDDCPNCAVIAAGQKNAEKITSAISEANRANERHAQQVLEAQDNANRVQIASALMNLQIANEQATSEQDAYNSGYALNFLAKNPKAFEGCLNENGEINQLFFDSPYLLDKLKNSYRNGVWNRVRAELNGHLTIPGAVEKFAEQAYSQGCKGSHQLKFELDVHFLINCKPSTQQISIGGSSWEYDESTCEYSFTPSLCTPPFSNKSIWDQYLKGVEIFVANENSPANIYRRKEEVRRAKLSGMIIIISLPLLYLFSTYMIYWLWNNNHGIFSALQLGAIVVAASCFDSIDEGIGMVLRQAFLLNMALIAYGLYKYFF